MRKRELLALDQFGRLLKRLSITISDIQECKCAAHVAEHLTRTKVSGFIKEFDTCPIANYIRDIAEVPSQIRISVTTIQGLQIFFQGTAYSKFISSLSFTLTPAMVKFIKDFDKGKYPFLVKK